MAGPCLTILLPEMVTDSQKEIVFNYINIISNKVESHDFWVSGHPFLLNFHEPDEDERAFVINGWHPKGTVLLCAMCNNHSSHVLLASVAIKIAEMLNGLIHLEHITKLTDSAVVLTLTGHVKLNELDYAVEPSYMSYWLGEPNFRLLK